MTMWYDEDEEELVENNGRTLAEIDENGELHLDLSDDQKKRELINITEQIEEDL